MKSISDIDLILGKRCQSFKTCPNYIEAQSINKELLTAKCKDCKKFTPSLLKNLMKPWEPEFKTPHQEARDRFVEYLYAFETDKIVFLHDGKETEGRFIPNSSNYEKYFLVESPAIKNKTHRKYVKVESFVRKQFQE